MDKREAAKRKAKAWLEVTHSQLEGTDLAYVLADQFKIDDQELLGDLIAYAQERWDLT